MSEEQGLNFTLSDTVKRLKSGFTVKAQRHQWTVRPWTERLALVKKLML